MAKLTPRQVDELLSLREKGWTVGQLAMRYGVCTSAIDYHCYKNGVEPPNPPPLQKVRPPVYMRGETVVRAYTPEEDAQIRELASDGVSIKEIARRLGRRYGSVRIRLMFLARHDERQSA